MTVCIVFKPKNRGKQHHVESHYLRPVSKWYSKLVSCWCVLDRLLYSLVSVFFLLLTFQHSVSFIVYLWTCMSEINWDDDDDE